MKKDPAVLFYPKDWLQGTASMYPEEKGIFVDLLMHQHQDGFLPNCTKRLARLVGVDHDRFQVIWIETLQHKFTAHPTQPSALINRRMDYERSQREVSAKRKSVMAIVGNWIKHSAYAKKMGVTGIAEMKKEIDWDFLNDSLDNEEIQNYLNDLSQSVAGRHAKRTAKRSQTANGNGIVDVNEIKTGNTEEGFGEKPGKIDLNEVARIYNAACPNLTQVQKMNDKRRGAVRARIQEYGNEAVGRVIQMVSESPFLNGDNEKGWTADFDWIFRPENFMKILEGKYKNNGKPRQQTGTDGVQYSDDFKRRIAERLQSR